MSLPIWELLKMLKIFNYTKAFWILILLSLCSPKPIIGQEYPGCFAIDRAQRVINLDGLCTAQKAKKTEEKPQVVKGIALSGLYLLDQGSSFPLMVGTITNKSNKTVQISLITLQLEDTATGTVVTTETVNVKSVLAPGQSRELRNIMSKSADLGGRRAAQLTVTFVDWE